MGLLDKVKGILFDEEEVEIPEIKKEPKRELKKEFIKEPIIEREEEINPIKELKVPKDDFSDKESYKSESTFTFPIDFEDDEPPVIEKKPVYVEKNNNYIKKDTKDYSSFLSRREEKKQFKPTPIISPVYGILDQNYKKEDVIVKKDILRKPSELTLEEVRKRAFGSLEEDLNLTSETKEDKVTKLKEELEKKNDVIVEEPIDRMKTIGELIEEDSVNIEIPNIDSIKDEEIEYNNIDETDIGEELEEPSNSIEDLLSREEIKETKYEDSDEIDDEEADLFSLIDSMYEEKGE